MKVLIGFTGAAYFIINAVMGNPCYAGFFDTYEDAESKIAELGWELVNPITEEEV